ncbi:hypothetical protein HBDW_10450 [Herbaspirillum sp. DW155]|uniref:hypothetical protein n=1 Tax=Herbaspirillum sp. DW155 TaxID=3095609 RepID=UPI00308CCA10|nr:hypothetical protein HBDW_10450 [Herbaspirillum sp. DW155]
MQHYCKSHRSSPGRTLGRHHVTVLLAIVIVVLQLWCSGVHHHALSDKSDDCVACQLAEQDLPPPLEAPQPDLSAVQYFLAGGTVVAPAYFFRQPISPYLAPYSQAPPVLSSRH